MLEDESGSATVDSVLKPPPSINQDGTRWLCLFSREQPFLKSVVFQSAGKTMKPCICLRTWAVTETALEGCSEVGLALSGCSFDFVAGFFLATEKSTYPDAQGIYRCSYKHCKQAVEILHTE